MPNININQFNGGNYQQFLPKSQAYNWGYEGELPYSVGYDNMTDEEFVNLLETELTKLPYNGCKQIRWKDHPTVDGGTRLRTLFKAGKGEYACLTGWGYFSSAWIRRKIGGVWNPFERMALFDSDYLKANSLIQAANLNGYIYPLYNYYFSPQSPSPRTHSFKNDGDLVFYKQLQYVFENIRVVGRIGKSDYEIKRTPVQAITTNGTILDLSRQRYFVATNKSLGSLTLNQEVVLANGDDTTFTINQLWTDTNYSWTIYTSNGTNVVLTNGGRSSFIYYSHSSYNKISNGTQYIVRPTQPSSTNLFINESQQYGTAKPILSAIYN